jgi:hypothetical protein
VWIQNTLKGWTTYQGEVISESPCPCGGNEK